MLDPGSAVHHPHLHPDTHSRGGEGSKGKACSPMPRETQGIQPHPLPVQGRGQNSITIITVNLLSKVAIYQSCIITLAQWY